MRIGDFIRTAKFFIMTKSGNTLCIAGLSHAAIIKLIFIGKPFVGLYAPLNPIQPTANDQHTRSWPDKPTYVQLYCMQSNAEYR